MSWKNLVFQLMALNAFSYSDDSILVLSIPLEETNRQDVSHADNHHRKLASESYEF